LYSRFTDVSGSSSTAHPAMQVCALFGTASLTPSGPARDARRSSWPRQLSQPLGQLSGSVCTRDSQMSPDPRQRLTLLCRCARYSGLRPYPGKQIITWELPLFWRCERLPCLPKIEKAGGVILRPAFR
jgi:hypothetical protein